jgi:restriction system protein
VAVGSQFARYINPLLAVLKNLGGSAKAAEAKGAVADFLRLSDDVLEDRLESGSSRFDNQVAWARYYLARAGYIDASRRGVWALTEKGRNTPELTDEPINDLVQGVIAEWGRRPQNVERPAGVDGSGRSEAEAPSPDEALGDHRSHLLNLIKGLPAAGFERLSQRLLREAGFEKVTVTGRAGDGGIDGVGVVEVNAFVSFKVLFQCKRYRDTPVGPSAVRDFRGAMQGRADKGLILTTASFTAEARREAGRDGAPPIELVDGEKLVDLFEQLELGLVPRKAGDVPESAERVT